MAVENWVSIQEISPANWACGYCGLHVGGNRGFYRNDGVMAIPNVPPQHPHNQPGAALARHLVTDNLPRILICPRCDRPTFFEKGKQVPGTAYGRPVQHLPVELGAVYEQTRQCMSVGAYVPAVLAARTMLMHVSVEQGAKEGESFAVYVDHLVNGGFVPPNAKKWVDHVRVKGNAATHKVALMSQDDAEKVLKFVEMILLFLYEYPAMA